MDQTTTNLLRVYLENKGVLLWNQVETTSDELRRMQYSDIALLHYRALLEYQVFSEIRSEIYDLLNC